MHNILDHISEIKNLIPSLDSSNNALSTHSHFSLQKILGHLLKLLRDYKFLNSLELFFIKLSFISGQTPSRPQQMRTTNREEQCSATNLWFSKYVSLQRCRLHNVSLPGFESPVQS